MTADVADVNDRTQMQKINVKFIKTINQIQFNGYSS